MHLREDLTWSDGKPFTAEDIEFSFKTILDGRLRGGGGQRRGCRPEGKRKGARQEDRPLRPQGAGSRSNDFSMNWPVIPKHLFAVTLAADPTGEKSEEHRKYAKMPVGNGPYVIVSRDMESEIVIERRKDWHLNAAGEAIREKPFFRRVRFRILLEPATILNELRAGASTTPC